MKCLYSELISLVPHSRSQEMSPLPDQLDEVINYVVELKARVEKQRDKKESLLKPDSLCLNGGTPARAFLSPEIVIHQVGSALEVALVTNESCCQLIFSEIVRVLQEEGAEILNASLSVIGDVAFHTIHSEVEDSEGNNGIGAAATMAERLRKLLQDRYLV